MGLELNGTLGVFLYECIIILFQHCSSIWKIFPKEQGLVVLVLFEEFC
jgi:hypothetical protein